MFLLVGSDDTRGDSEEEYIPNLREESTEREGSLELSLKRKKMNKIGSAGESRSKSSSQSQCESSQSRNFETRHDSTQKCPDEGLM